MSTKVDIPSDKDSIASLNFEEVFQSCGRFALRCYQYENVSTPAIMANTTEVEKYEVLEKIGIEKPNRIPRAEHATNHSSGHGSFGIIRKVKRQSDGLVSVPKSS